MKPLNYYGNSTITPQRASDFMTVYVYQQGKILFSGSNREYLEFLNRSYDDGMVVEKIVDKQAFAAHRKSIDDDLERLRTEFKNDLLAHHGFSSDDELPNKTYNLAVKYFGDESLERVVQAFAEFIDLVY